MEKTLYIDYVSGHYEARYNIGLKTVSFMTDYDIENIMYKAKKQIEQAQIARLAAIAKKKEDTKKRIIEQAEKLELWKQGQDIRANFEFTALRIKDNEIETSRGAKVPIESAKLLYSAIKAGLNVCGQSIGHFYVNSINSENITIGCHVIPMTEIDRIGALL